MAARVAKLDVDGENLSVIECGSKSAIPFVAKICAGLRIPFCVMHDQDLWPVPDDLARATKVQQENAAARKLNEQIEGIAAGSCGLFVLKPTLEDALGISRNAKDKPRRIADALAALPATEWPEEVTAAVAALRPPNVTTPGDGAKPPTLPRALPKDPPPGFGVPERRPEG
jgi:hypothetical protein